MTVHERFSVESLLGLLHSDDSREVRGIDPRDYLGSFSDSKTYLGKSNFFEFLSYNVIANNQEVENIDLMDMILLN